MGSEVPSGDLTLRVHSVFRAAAYLRLPDGALLALLSAEADDAPFGIRLASREDFLTLDLTPGDRCVLSSRGLAIERSTGRGLFRVNCGAVRRLAASPLPSLCDRRPPPRRSDSALLEALQERAATELRVAPFFSDTRPVSDLGARLTGSAQDLGRAVRYGDVGAMRDAMARLVGLGPGLTPAGDDFLCGFIAAAHCRCGGFPVRQRRLSQLVAAVEGLLDRTTDISAAFLRSALGGGFSTSLAALAEAYAGGTTGAINRAIRRLAAVGHSSGLDAATGFFCGAAVWAEAPGELSVATVVDTQLRGHATGRADGSRAARRAAGVTGNGRSAASRDHILAEAPCSSTSPT